MLLCTGVFVEVFRTSSVFRTKKCPLVSGHFLRKPWLCLLNLVGAIGFEPTTPTMSRQGYLSVQTLLRNRQIFRNQQDLRAPPYRSSSADLEWCWEGAFFDSCIPRGATDPEDAQDLGYAEQSIIGRNFCCLHLWFLSSCIAPVR